MSRLLMAFYGDDFTGSTDALESLALAGIRTRLFTRPPTRAELDAIDGLQAFGVASRARAMPPAQMQALLREDFASLRKTGAPLIHYKVCSTFDSSPTLGSIGRAIDLGAEIFSTQCVPIVGGAPHLGRYCVFGNLFARGSADPSPVRLDRHPNLRDHPATPMDESDLRLHLAKQTGRSIGLMDLVQLESIAFERHYRALLEAGHGAVLIDYHSEAESARIGMLLHHHAGLHDPLFVVGSSGVEAVLTALRNQGHHVDPSFRAPTPSRPLLVVVGSCSPVSARQVAWAGSNGFGTSVLAADEADDLETIRDAATMLEHGRSVVIHTGAALGRRADRDRIGLALAKATRTILERVRVKRLLVAGGDTSGHIADALAIHSLEMVAPLVRGAPLCRASASLDFVDHLEVVFKGGQIGDDGFFGLVERGTTGTYP